jgi:acyl carrier protein
VVEGKVRNWVRQHLAQLLGIAPADVAFDRTLENYGLDSVDAVLMAGELEEALNIEIDPASFIQYENFEQMIAALESKIASSETIA